MARMSPDSLEYFAVEPRANTRRYEKRERPVITSSDRPPAKALSPALAPAYLNGNTATQKPSSARAAPESVVLAFEAGGAGFAGSSAISSPALRSPSITLSTYSGSHHFLNSWRTVCPRLGRRCRRSRIAFAAASRSPSWPHAAASIAWEAHCPGRLIFRAKSRAPLYSPWRYAL